MDETVTFISKFLAIVWKQIPFYVILLINVSEVFSFGVVGGSYEN